MFRRLRRASAKPKDKPQRPMRYKGAVFGQDPLPTLPPGQNTDATMKWPTTDEPEPRRS